MVNVFSSENDAIYARVIDLEMWQASGNHHAEVWDNIKKRYDAEEWFYEVCPNGIQTHTQKEAQDSWIKSTEDY